MPLLRDLAIGQYFATVQEPRIDRTKDNALLLRQESSKGSLKTKRFRAALNDDYLARVLGL